MGGIPCIIQRNAILKFKAVPTDPVEQTQFDEQMRRLYATVATSVADDAPYQAQAMCTILAKPTFTQEDRAALLSVIESLYPASWNSW